ncbi:MAG TPA: HlyD family type I secretion periplasmic adaptor subunit [Tabrizicola sp.]|nr:HlyD family type I secretion periplasmic adaptor subunit [Tabrizicola sp.]
MSGVRFPIRAPLILGLAATLTLVLGFGLWATTARLSGAVIAPGRIEVERDRQVVQHPDGGVVAEILVREGSVVAAGDELLRLDGAALQSELTIVDGQLTELFVRQARLVAERDDAPVPSFPAELADRTQTDVGLVALLDGERRLFDARRATLAEERALLAERIGQIRAEADGLSAQEAALTLQLGLVDQDLSAQQALLDKGLAQAAGVRALLRERARLQGLLGDLAAQRARAEGQVTELRLAIANLTTRRQEVASEELRQIGPQLRELRERRRALQERIDRLEIRAPVAGVVMGLQVTTPRAVLRPAEPALVLIPVDRPLVITARIAPIQIDEVLVGQPAEVLFPAFAARTTPHLQGRVTRLSPDAINDSRTGVSYYTAEVELAGGEAARLGETLRPGMPVEVYLQTGQHTPLAYLLQPFTDYFHRAFRES